MRHGANTTRAARAALRRFGATRKPSHVSQRSTPLSSGRLAYDPQKASDCIAELRTDRCSGPQAALSGACIEAWRGQVPEGGACRILDPEFGVYGLTIECVSGTRCATEIALDWAGTCRPYAAEGENCYGIACGAGLSCSFGVCVPIVGEGLPCQKSDQAVWGALGNCDSGLFCDGEENSTDGVCRKSKTSGPCLDTSQCEWDFSCRPAGEGGGRTCQRKKVPGEECTRDHYECWGHCGQDGKCALWASEGEDCGWFESAEPDGEVTQAVEDTTEIISCGRGLFCDVLDSSSGTCRQQLNENDACWRYPGILTMSRPQCQGNDTILGYCQASARDTVGMERTGRCAVR